MMKRVEKWTVAASVGFHLKGMLWFWSPLLFLAPSNAMCSYYYSLNWGFFLPQGGGGCY